MNLKPRLFAKMRGCKEDKGLNPNGICTCLEQFKYVHPILCKFLLIPYRGGKSRCQNPRIRAFQEDQFVSFGFGTHDWHCGVTDLRCGPAHVLAGKCQWRKGLCVLPGTGHGFWDMTRKGLGGEVCRGQVTSTYMLILGR